MEARGDGGEDTDEAHRQAGLTLAPRGGGATSPGARWALFAGLAALIVALDQLTKAWLVGMLGPGERMSVVGDTIRLVHAQNTGALFGLFRDSAPLFAAVSVGVLAIIVIYHARARGTLFLSGALGLLLGGAVGNLIDRVRLGHVVDFVDVGIGDLRFYTFNIADSAISIAILLLIVASLFPSIVEDRGSPHA
jgi:signal peptidase II